MLSGRDLWGARLLASADGPTYAAAKGYLQPLFYAVRPGGGRATESGAYYLPLTFAFSPYGPRGFALHVADGSEIITRWVGGRHLTVFVGKGGQERYGSCLERLGPPTLARGYLPILDTSYLDAGGVRYAQESFVGRLPGTKALVSFIRLTVDAHASRIGAVVRLAPSVHGLRDIGDRLLSTSRPLLAFSRGGSFDGRAVRYSVRPGRRIQIFAIWLNDADPGAFPELRADRTLYEAARRVTSRLWETQLARGAAFIVPERRVLDAEQALLAQELAMTWRYSVGNAYEELSFSEALDVADVMGGYGYGDIAKAILRFALRRLPERFSSRRAGERLAAGALYYRLFRDRAYVREETPELATAVGRLGREIERPGGSGLVDPEAVSNDIATRIYGLHTQTAVWEGLLAMGRVWSQTGYSELSARCRTLAARLGAAVHRAVRASERWLPDRSLFVPLALLDRARPFERLTASRAGTYWNLLMPYALASGFFPAHGRQARGVVRYLQDHGARLLGLVRSADFKLYGKPAYPVSGTDQVYGLNLARFLADNDQPDQLALSLYGMLAAGMTANTDVAGEGATVAPLHGARERTMLLPPNSAANAAFLETLRLMLVHETRDRNDVPTGLELAYATPRAWLESGKAIQVRDAPTSFGHLSYTIRRRGNTVDARLEVPAVPSLHLRLRLPAGIRIAAVRLGHHTLRFDTRSQTIDLSGHRGRLDLEATLTRVGR